MSELVVAVDPGREKCGIAVVHARQGLLEKRIIATPELKGTVEQLLQQYGAAMVILGNRTTSKTARGVLGQIHMDGRPLSVELVDEHRSTDEARGRYWQEHRPRGLKRLIPLGMQVPPEPVDDYVAVILAERYFNGTIVNKE